MTIFPRFKRVLGLEAQGEIALGSVLGAIALILLLLVVVVRVLGYFGLS